MEKTNFHCMHLLQTWSFKEFVGICPFCLSCIFSGLLLVLVENRNDNETEQNCGMHHFRTSVYHTRKEDRLIQDKSTYEIRSNCFYILGPFGQNPIELFFFNFRSDRIRYLLHSYSIQSSTVSGSTFNWLPIV